ncbi:MAG: hypothetical protein QOE65_299 [Solirubrobacteraceae bacterium]|jgi:hypothetical protein|nr:hypothetical protein [Solirubrobacteraceae bacterium]
MREEGNGRVADAEEVLRLRERVRELEVALEAVRRDREYVTHRLHETEARAAEELHALRGSTSWRITAPLRGLRRATGPRG